MLRLTEREDEWVGIARSWAPIHGLTTNMAKYLTACVPSLNDGTPLLALCIKKAIEGWHEADSEGDRGRYHAYLRGLLHPLPQALECSLHIPSNDATRAWKPLDESVSAWWRREGRTPRAQRRERPKDTTYVEVNPADYRFLVLVKFAAPGAVALASLALRFDDLVGRYG